MTYNQLLTFFCLTISISKAGVLKKIALRLIMLEENVRIDDWVLVMLCIDMIGMRAGPRSGDGRNKCIPRNRVSLWMVWKEGGRRTEVADNF